MKNRALTQDEFDLIQLQKKAEALRTRENELAATQRKLASARSDMDSTLPPSELIQSIGRRKAHDQLATKGQIKIARREEKQNLMLMIALIAATTALVWWGFKLMHG